MLKKIWRYHQWWSSSILGLNCTNHTFNQWKWRWIRARWLSQALQIMILNYSGFCKAFDFIIGFVQSKHCGKTVKTNLNDQHVNRIQHLFDIANLCEGQENEVNEAVWSVSCLTLSQQCGKPTSWILARMFLILPYLRFDNILIYRRKSLMRIRSRMQTVDTGESILVIIKDLPIIMVKK